MQDTAGRPAAAHTLAPCEPCSCPGRAWRPPDPPSCCPGWQSPSCWAWPRRPMRSGCGATRTAASPPATARHRPPFPTRTSCPGPRSAPHRCPFLHRRRRLRHPRQQLRRRLRQQPWQRRPRWIVNSKPASARPNRNRRPARRPKTPGRIITLCRMGPPQSRRGAGKRPAHRPLQRAGRAGGARRRRPRRRAAPRARGHRFGLPLTGGGNAAQVRASRSLWRA